ncbi:MAG: PilZ domain-containing protein [Rhodospirillaceae bacterium]|jgi:hypothetical protein|nr:PilZ domain-containing protein [Rhodospirillaceae bacterium]MBT5455156.1 PilZ domain-containing protein [Rhodospirillaceae bacterium]
MSSNAPKQRPENLLELVGEEDEQEEFRGSPRRHLVRTGELEVGGDRIACFIIDLSKKGTKIRTLEPLELEQSTVRLHMPEIGTFDAEVRWVRNTEIGLQLQEEIEAPEEHESVMIEDILRLQGEE